MTGKGPDRGDQLQVAVGVGRGLDVGRLGHEVLDAEHLQMLDAFGHVGRGRVVEAAHRVGGLVRELGRVEEVVGRGGRRLVVEALLGADAAVGPVGQEHQGVGGAHLVELGLVLPHGPPAAVRRVLAQLLHLGDQGEVLLLAGLARVW